MKFRFSGIPPVSQDKSAGALRVLLAAKRTFIHVGGGGFSARAVAKEAGITLGAVQYFFPTTELLLAAVLEFVVNEYETAYDALFQKLPYNGEARLLGVVDVLLSSNWETETRQIFYGLYALSCHNDFAGKLMEAMYDRHVQHLASLIGGARPHLSETRCYELAVHIAATIDGTMLFTGRARKGAITRSALLRVVQEGVLDLLDSPRYSVKPAPTITDSRPRRINAAPGTRKRSSPRSPA